MADFRKWLIALAAVAVLLCLGSPSAQAQTQNAAFTCSTNAGAPNIVRAEGVAELVGDLVLNCTGGQPTPAGQQIPLSNVQVSLNTNITSRIVNPANSASEALILIDEPLPANNTEVPTWGTASAPLQPTAPNLQALQQQACFAVNSTNCAITSVGSGIGTLGSYSGETNHLSAGPHYNIFQGFQQTASTVAWNGVPIDAPGTAGVRVIRITNIRANASLLGVSSTFVPTQITELIGVNGSQSILINNPNQVVGLAEKGLTTGVYTSTYTQCVPLNSGLLTGGTSGTFIGNTAPGATATLTATEGFAYSFKPRNYAQIAAVPFTGGGTTAPYVGDTADGLQNLPGYTYHTESGFIPGAGLTGLQGAASVGEATQGTQISFTITGVPSGVSLFAPAAVQLTSPNYALGQTQGYAVLVGSSGGLGALSQLTVSGTTASATYEIWYSDPSSVESLAVPVYAAYISNTAQNLPAPGTATVATNFAPPSTVPTASSSAPIPRFAQLNSPVTLFNINQCTCNLLFPFVTNQAGFDTGVAIANTTADTLNNVTPQQGNVELTYYGSTTGGGAAPPSATTTSVVPAGGELIFTLSGGGNFGIPATPGFQGYIIARAAFQYCHGFAFISDAGAQKLAEGYLAIQLDLPELNRTGVPGENLGN